MNYAFPFSDITCEMNATVIINEDDDDFSSMIYEVAMMISFNSYSINGTAMMVGDIRILH